MIELVKQWVRNSTKILNNMIPLDRLNYTYVIQNVICRRQLIHFIKAEIVEKTFWVAEKGGNLIVSTILGILCFM